MHHEDCGMINNQQTPVGLSPGSLAWAGLGKCYYWIDLAKGVGGVYATQILPFADNRTLACYDAFEKIVNHQ